MIPTVQQDERPLFRSGPIAFSRVLRSYKIWLFVSSLFLMAAITFVLPIYHELRELLDHLPTAEGYFGGMQLDEIERLHPELKPTLGLYGVVAMLVWTFFGGGACALSEGRAQGLSEFLATCGRFFFRSLRTWLVFIVAFLVWSWIWNDVLIPFLETKLETGGNAKMLFRFVVASEVIFVIGLVKLLMLRRLALARIVLEDRRSAVRAWFSAIGFMVLHPIRTVVGFLGVALIGAIALVSCGIALSALGDRFVLGLLVAVLVLVVYQAALLASFAVARLLLETEIARRSHGGESEEPIVAPLSDPLRLGT